MNYGKFFRLNKNLSRIEEGYAVYDYIDLPAYFTRSIDNQMSPKYPVSMTVLADSVVFKLHYSAYKIEESSDVLPDQIDPKYPKYLYDIKDNTQNGGGSLKSGDATKIVHMEETILELPYTDTVGRNLSDTIRDIYNTNFPLILNATDESGSNTKRKDSSGGRFLHNLIRKRYLEENIEEERDIHSHFYHSLRRISDGTPSYSTLWLMGLVTGDKDNVRYVRTDKKGNIVGFLRKLLLDFMFDMKHSDVFQNSSQFQKMFSGLMSNFYFSALMHKCEYYYYRKLTSQAIQEIGGNENKDVNDKKQAIKILYANELVKAEDQWVHDIMSPQAEKEFEHRYPGKYKTLREFVEIHTFEKWPSWFAEPEEEMRRVCFTMKENNTGEKHICNADTLIRFLELDKNSKDQMETNMIDLRNNEKEQVSRWFLKHYAFSDVLHLHLFKHANLFFLIVLVLPILISWFTRESLPIVYLWTFSILFVPCIAFCTHYSNCKSCGLRTCRKRAWNSIHYVHVQPDSAIVKTRNEIAFGKKWKTALVVVLSLALVWLGQCSCINEFIKDVRTSQPFLTYLIVICLIVAGIYFLTRRSLISVLHLFLPRLVASITLAWFTLSMGFDLYVSYFDSIPSLSYIVVICVIVLFFVVYSINLVIPYSPTLRKFIRGVELMVISYIISLFVGFVIINFLGEKYLERGGYIGDYYEQHVNRDTSSFVKSPEIDSSLFVNTSGDTCLQDSIQTIYKLICSMDTTAHTTESHTKLVDNLQRIKMENREYKIAAKIDFWGTNIFILRDFLIMFAFIAMFTGIFIQLIIFGDNKQMTEL